MTANELEDLPVVGQRVQDRLTDQQLLDYRTHREQFLEWALEYGQDPDEQEGYATTTLENYAHGTERFLRWVWDERGYTTDISHDDANRYCEEIAGRDYGQWTKLNYQKALKVLFRWREYEFDEPSWDPRITFSQPSDSRSSRDYLSVDERRRIREAVADYETSPHYESFSPEERERYKEYVAGQLAKSSDEVTVADFDRISAWKYTSLVWTSLDTGLRPVEVQRASTEWIDVDRGRLLIPAEDAKNDTDWDPVLRDATVESLQNWLFERIHRPLYDDTDALWLTQKGNAYSSQALSRLAKRLAEEAGIDQNRRQITWYSFRRGLATALIDQADVSTAQEQLRHRDLRSTTRYDQAPPERRRQALDDLG